MFQPIFVFDSKNPSPAVILAELKNFRMMDIREVGASVHGGNPAVIVYDESADASTLDTISGRDRFLPPKKTGVMLIFGKGKGHIRGLPDPREFIEWFAQKPVQYLNGLTGNFRV